VPARLISASSTTRLPIEALNLYSEAEREGYITVTRQRTHPVVRVRVRSIHPIADKVVSWKYA